MKYISICLLFLSTVLFADFSVEELSSISYDRSDIRIEQKQDVTTGVDNFYVDGDHLYLLSSSQNVVFQYSIANGALMNKIAVPAFAMDIAVVNGVVFVLGTDDKFHIVNQRKVSSHKIEKSFAHGLQVIDGSPVIHLANGTTYNPTSEQKITKGWQFAANASVFTEKVSPNMGKVTVTVDGNIHVFDVPTVQELGSIVAVGLDSQQVFVRLEILESSSPIQVTQKVVALDLVTRSQASSIDVPKIQANFSYNDCKYIDGQLIKMVLTPSAVDVVALRTNQDGGTWKYDYTYDYNNNLLQVEEVVDNSEKEEPKKRISRSQIVWNAEEYLSSSWSCSSKNKTSGIKTLPNGSKIRTPSWVTSGYHYKIPYKWGGFTSVYTFEQKASQGKYTGSDYTKSVAWGDNDCVGVDCSGFVSRAWGTSKKYGTSTIGQISTQLSSTSKLKKGDALNKRGSHIVLVVENNPSGSVSVIEASGIDWAVSKRTRYFSSMSGYKPIYYNNVSEW